MPLIHQIVRTGKKKDIAIALYTFANELNTVDSAGLTPLMILASRPYVKLESAQQLINIAIENGADINLNPVRGRTALYYAVERQSYHAVIALLQHSPRVDFLTDMSYSIMHKAVLCGNMDIVHALFTYCDEETLLFRDLITGNTFLHELVHYRRIFRDILEEVITSTKCDRVVHICNKASESPLMTAALQARRSGNLIFLLHSRTQKLTSALSLHDFNANPRFLLAQAIVRQEVIKRSQQ